jgi:hypothetical protein
VVQVPLAANEPGGGKNAEGADGPACARVDTVRAQAVVAFCGSLTALSYNGRTRYFATVGGCICWGVVARRLQLGRERLDGRRRGLALSLLTSSYMHPDCDMQRPDRADGAVELTRWIPQRLTELCHCKRS